MTRRTEPSTIHWSRLLALSIFGFLLPLAACPESQSDPTPPTALAPDEKAETGTKPAEAGPLPMPKRVDIAVPSEDPNRWLAVEAVRGDAPGAWADGTFDAKSNKVIIDTHDVQRFAVDSSRIPIRWEKLVIIRIDGRNSELVRRDQTIYRFAIDEHGQWMVIGPS